MIISETEKDGSRETGHSPPRPVTDTEKNEKTRSAERTSEQITHTHEGSKFYRVRVQYSSTTSVPGYIRHPTKCTIWYTKILT